MLRALQAKIQVVHTLQAALEAPCSASQMLCRGAATGPPPQTSFEDKAAEVSDASLHPSARLGPPPVAQTQDSKDRPSGVSCGQEPSWGRTDRGHCARSLFCSSAEKVPLSLPLSLWVKATSVPRGEIALLQRLAVELRHGAPGTVCPGTGWGIGEHRAPCPLATISTTGACQHRTLK